MSKKIRVAVVGVGNCASALIQGIQYYINNPEDNVGLMFKDIGGYTAEHIEFVVGFDVDARKVGKRLNDAIYSLPNCTMQVIPPHSDMSCIASTATVFRSPTLDGIADHMRSLDPAITFVESEKPAITDEDYITILEDFEVDVLLCYVPVGAQEAAKFHIENAIKAGVHIVNCMPTYISTNSAKELEKLAIKNKVTIVGSDMRSAVGASRLSEVLQGMFLDAGLMVTQHIQENKACGMTQGDIRRTGRSANTDFMNMREQERLHDKHISKEAVLTGQSVIRNISVDGTTQYAGPSLTVMQRPGGEYIGSDNKVANIDMIAFGWGGAIYNLTARLSVQDSPNSGGIVFDAVRFCKVASEMGIKGYLRGASAYSQKSPPVHMKSQDSIYECNALSMRMITPMTQKQIGDNINLDELDYTFQSGKSSYE